ncbi:MAG: acyl-CoA dehydrogenase family protein [Jatrophihabitantaceae bacterium]
MSELLYTDVEEQLRSSVRELLDKRAPSAAVLARTESDERYDPALWTALAMETGVAGLAVPESAGGHGASWREVAVVAEELGRSVAGTPFLGSAVLSTALALSAAAHDLLAGLASGSTTAALAVALSTTPGAPFPTGVRLDGSTVTGTVRSVADVELADVLVVPAIGSAGPVVVSVRAADVLRAGVVPLDLTRPLTDLTFESAAASVIASGDAAVQALTFALEAGAVVLAGEQVGLAERCLQLSVEHLRTRYQFGRPIGSFQALKHRAADLWSAITQARAVARYAADCLAAVDPDAPIAACLAQAYCGPVAVKAAEECVQLHGGIGFTWEHPAHLYLKRAKADAIALGTASQHRARLATLVDLPAA